MHIAAIGFTMWTRIYSADIRFLRKYKFERMVPLNASDVYDIWSEATALKL